MHAGAHRFQHPPPPWPPIGEGMTLHAYLDPEAPQPGQLLDLSEARRRLRAAAPGAP
jgi:hypothetical protein